VNGTCLKLSKIGKSNTIKVIGNKKIKMSEQDSQDSLRSYMSEGD
jgi:hypothetical protein